MTWALVFFWNASAVVRATGRPVPLQPISFFHSRRGLLLVEATAKKYRPTRRTAGDLSILGRLGGRYCTIATHRISLNRGGELIEIPPGASTIQSLRFFPASWLFDYRLKIHEWRGAASEPGEQLEIGGSGG